MEDEKQGDVTIDLFASLDMDSVAVGERSTEFENNQNLGLLTGFLAVDDWYASMFNFFFGSGVFQLNIFGMNLFKLNFTFLYSVLIILV